MLRENHERALITTASPSCYGKITRHTDHNGFAVVQRENHERTLITTALPSCYGRITRTQKRRTVKSAFWLNVAIKGGADQRAYTSRLRLADICVEVIPRGGGFDVALTNREAAEAFA